MRLRSCWFTGPTSSGVGHHQAPQPGEVDVLLLDAEGAVPLSPLVQNLAQAQRIIGEFVARWNAEWLTERLGHRTPAASDQAKRERNCR